MCSHDPFGPHSPFGQVLVQMLIGEGGKKQCCLEATHTCARCLPVQMPRRADSVCRRMATKLEATTTHTCMTQGERVGGFSVIKYGAISSKWL